MSDLISRQAAIDAMAELQGRASTKAELRGISKAWKRIKQLPSAQPERKTGKWIKQTKFGRLECDVCGHVFKTYFRPRNFCPNCGADMRGDQNED